MLSALYNARWVNNPHNTYWGASSDSEGLRLREPLQNIRDLDVYDSSGEQIGSIEDLYVNQEAKEGRLLK